MAGGIAERFEETANDPVNPCFLTWTASNANRATCFRKAKISATIANENRSPELRAAASDIDRRMADGKLKSQIDRVLPLSQAAEAHRLQEESTLRKTSTLRGKIVLKP